MSLSSCFRVASQSLSSKTSITLLVAALSLASCGQQQDHSQESQSKALISQSQLGEAKKIVSAIDYIPFSYKFDGCYARSLVMSMALASEEIPSSAVFIVAEKPYGAEGLAVESLKHLSWRYHVAPLVRVKGSQENLVIDPSTLALEAPINDWLKTFNATSGTQVIKHGSKFFTRDLFVANDNRHEPLLQSFEDMKGFSSQDASLSFSVLSNYIMREKLKGGQAEAEAKMERFYTALTGMIEKLDKLQKFDNANAALKQIERTHKSNMKNIKTLWKHQQAERLANDASLKVTQKDKDTYYQKAIDNLSKDLISQPSLKISLRKRVSCLKEDGFSEEGNEIEAGESIEAEKLVFDHVNVDAEKEGILLLEFVYEDNKKLTVEVSSDVLIKFFAGTRSLTNVDAWYIFIREVMPMDIIPEGFRAQEGSCQQKASSSLFDLLR